MKEFTINELVEANWFPYRNRITIRKYIDFGELKAIVRKYGGIQNHFMIREEDAIKFANLTKDRYKTRFNF